MQRFICTPAWIRLLMSRVYCNNLCTREGGMSFFVTSVTPLTAVQAELDPSPPKARQWLSLQRDSLRAKCAALIGNCGAAQGRYRYDPIHAKNWPVCSSRPAFQGGSHPAGAPSPLAPARQAAVTPRYRLAPKGSKLDCPSISVSRGAPRLKGASSF